MRLKFMVVAVPFALLGLSPSANAQEEPYPSPMCHNWAVACGENYQAMGYSSASSCWDAKVQGLYCPPPPEEPYVNTETLYYIYAGDYEREYCWTWIDCNGPITPPGPIEN